MKIHEKKIKVTEEHIDRLKHVNNAQYVKWVEIMAEEHWNKLKLKTSYPDDYWVMAEHHLYYHKQVFLDEILLAKTYPMEPEGLKQPRMVEFYRDDELVVKSKTYWILIDHKTHRIKRLNRSDLTFLD